MRRLPAPTETELAILNVLWARDGATVREVFEALYSDEAAYTTALKLLQVMHAKGLVSRDESQRAHVYRAAVSKDFTQRRLLSNLIRGVFDGSPGELVLRALGGEQAPSAEELDQIRDLIDRMERERHDR
ncbi:MAG: BlaI/MecI/CopY family transcriptional regulator [Lysobacteraceae bacterium]